MSVTVISGPSPSAHHGEGWLILRVGLPRLRRRLADLRQWVADFSPERHVEAANDLGHFPGSEALALLAALPPATRPIVLDRIALDEESRQAFKRIAEQLGDAEHPRSLAHTLLQMHPSVIEPSLDVPGDDLRAAAAALNRSWKALARGELRDALEISQKALSALPENDDPGIMLARAAFLDVLGTVHGSTGQFAQAGEDFERGFALLQRVAKWDPGNANWQLGLSVSRIKHGGMAMAEGNLSEAQRLYAESLQITQRLAESDPLNADKQRNLWLSHCRVAQVFEKQEDAKAIDHWRKAQDILANMVQQGLHVSPQDREVLQQLRAKLDSSSG